MSGLPHAKWLAMVQSPRCGAKRRDHKSCQSPAMRNGRCRMHGGKSTGPKTKEGIERLRAANTRHGLRSAGHLQERREARASIRRLKNILAALSAECPY